MRGSNLSLIVFNVLLLLVFIGAPVADEIDKENEQSTTSTERRELMVVDELITWNIEDEKIGDVLKELSNKFEFRLKAPDHILDDKVSTSFDTLPLRTVLTKLLKPFSYIVVYDGNNISDILISNRDDTGENVLVLKKDPRQSGINHNLISTLKQQLKNGEFVPIDVGNENSYGLDNRERRVNQDLTVNETLNDKDIEEFFKVPEPTEESALTGPVASTNNNSENFPTPEPIYSETGPPVFEDNVSEFPQFQPVPSETGPGFPNSRD